MKITRRSFLATTTLAALAAPRGIAADVPAAFAQRGYYMLLNRTPLFGLEVWKDIVDGAAEDGANHLIVWIAGGFASKKFPITWRYNAEHRNVRADFVAELIRHAHTRGVRILLGLTPFGYDGVNQFTIEHPELMATSADGRPTPRFGIHCWGWSLCPAKAESQRLMLEYARELIANFYPEADGLFIESSDYSICHCAECGARHFDHEFKFVRAISDEIWARKPDATVVVYPHYFSGAKVTVDGGVQAAKQPFDPRWTLFFTPHSAPPDAALIRAARASWWWNDAPAFCNFRGVKAGAAQARAAGFTGYMPTLECYNYLATEAEDGHAWTKGRRQIPFGFGWLAEGASPYRELPLRVMRVACREWFADPAAPEEKVRAAVGRELFGEAATLQLIEDALALTRIFSTDRNWSTPPALTAPGLIAERKQRGQINPAQLAQLRAQLATARDLAARHTDATLLAAKQLATIARWLDAQWRGDNEVLLNDAPAASAEQPKSP